MSGIEQNTVADQLALAHLLGDICEVEAKLPPRLLTDVELSAIGASMLEVYEAVMESIYADVYEGAREQIAGAVSEAFERIAIETLASAPLTSDLL